VLLVALGIQALILAAPPGTQEAPDEESELELLFTHPEVVSGATKSQAPEDLRDAPAVVTVLTAEDLAHWGVRTLSDVLNVVPECYIGGDDSYLLAGLRGFAQDGSFNDRILVLLDGHVLDEPFGAYVGVGSDLPLDFSMIERIEVISGPVSALYGSNAFFGAINIVTRHARGKTGRVFGDWGNVGFYRGTASWGNGSNGAEPWHVETYATANSIDGELEQTNDALSTYSNRGKAGYDEHAWDRNASAFVRASTGDLTVTGAAFSRRKGYSSAYDNDPTTNGRPWDQDSHALLQAEYAVLTSGPVRVRTRLYGDLYAFDQFLPTDGLPGSGEGFHARAAWGGAEAVAEWNAGPSNLVASLEAAHYDVALHTFDERQNYALERGTLQERVRLGSWGSVVGGAYVERSDPFGFGFAPRLAFIAHPFASTTLKALYGNGFRHPSLYELANAEDVAGIYSIGHLHSEQVNSFEVEARQQVAWPVEVFADAFRMRATRLIVTDSAANYTNAGAVDDDGATLGVKVHLTHAQLRVDGTVFRMRDQDGNRIQGAPDWIAHAVAQGELVPARLYGTARVLVTGPIPDIDLQDLKPYVWLDASLDAPAVWKGLGLTLTGFNLFDAHVSQVKDVHAYDMPHRRVGLQAHWDW